MSRSVSNTTLAGVMMALAPDDGVRHPAEQLELPIAQGVMHQRAVGLGGEVGHAREVEDRQVLGVGAGHRTDRAELADAVGGADGADTPDAGVAVGGVGGVEFVAAADPVDIGMRDDGVLHGEGEIAWHAEDVGHADVVEPVQHVIDDGGCGHDETPSLGALRL